MLYAEKGEVRPDCVNRLLKMPSSGFKLKNVSWASIVTKSIIGLERLLTEALLEISLLDDWGNLVT